MSEVTLRQMLTYRGIETVNAIVEQLSMDDAHEAIRILREHLEARAEQTRSLDDFSDLLGATSTETRNDETHPRHP